MAGLRRWLQIRPSSPSIPGLPEVNELLSRYTAWHDLLDAWVVLAVDDPQCVYNWRLQAEQAMAAQGRPGMSDAQVADFVSRYMPAYHASCRRSMRPHTVMVSMGSRRSW